MSAPGWFFRRAMAIPDRIALVDATGRGPRTGATTREGKPPAYTYRALAERAARLATRLRTLGVRRGDRVAILAPNRLEHVDLLFATAALGAVFVPLNFRLHAEELRELLADAQPRILFYADAEPFSAMAVDLARDLDLHQVPDLAVLPLGEEYEAGLQGVETEQVAALLEEILQGGQDIGMEDPWMLLYTGGTTGKPKGAVISHRQVIWNAVNTVTSWELSPCDIAPVFTPLFHTGGLNVFLTPLLHRGGRLVLTDKFDPERALYLIESEGMTLVFMVPTMYHMLVELPGFVTARLQSVRWFISGGAPCPEPIYEAFRSRGLIFKEGYGLTEVGPNNFVLPLQDIPRKAGSVGFPVLHAAARVVDEDGRDVPPGEVGELILSGPHMCSGYWRNVEATRAASRDGWWYTGDLARRDEEGYFWIVGRKKDVIISGGENIYPLEIETVLHGHPAIAEAAVVGVPDPKWGERVKAVVVPREGHRLTAEEVQEYCRRHLAGYKVPRLVEFRDALPKNAAGKVLKRELQHPLPNG